MDAAHRALYFMKEQYRQNPSSVKHATIAGASSRYVPVRA